MKWFDATFDSKCRNKNLCSIDIKADKMSFMDQNAPAGCSSKRSIVFVQYTCEITEDEKSRKKKEITIITAHVLFVAFLYLGLVYYLRDSS